MTSSNPSGTVATFLRYMPQDKEVHWLKAVPGVHVFSGCSDLAYCWEKQVPMSRKRATVKEKQVLVVGYQVDVGKHIIY